MRQWIDLFENADVNALEARFGNDNYPFHYEDEEDLTPDEIAELDAEDPERERGPSIITDCGPWFSCDSWAEYVVQQLPGRAKAYGFWCEENPGTELEKYCDGHTFAIVDDRYIVDGWIKNVEGILPRAVFDLNDPADAKIVQKYYGPRTKWKPINKTLEESVERFNTGRREVLVHVNPPASALKNIVERTKHQIARGFAYGGSIYIWDAISAIHQQIWKQVTDDGPNVGVFMVSADLDTLIADSTGEIGQPSDFLFFKDRTSGLFLYTMKARSFLLHDRSFKALFRHLIPIDYREGITEAYLVENTEPGVLYHGTRKSNVEEIKKHGLKPDMTKSSLPAVFLTDSKFIADNYRFMHIAGEDWTVLEIDMNKLDWSKLGPDNFELADALADDANEERTWDECTWEESLEICNQVAYHGVIPPDAIMGEVLNEFFKRNEDDDYYDYDDGEKNLGFFHYPRINLGLFGPKKPFSFTYRGCTARIDGTISEDEVSNCKEAYSMAVDRLDSCGLIQLIKRTRVEFFEVPNSENNAEMRGWAPNTASHKVWVRSDLWSVDDMEDAIIHELGHTLNYRVSSSLIEAFVKYFVMIRRDDDDWFPTDYSRTNFMEFFAEVFAAYVYGRLNEKQHNWMQRFAKRYMAWR
jgi:hypothetical protein